MVLCVYNDQKFETPKRRKVDNQKFADFLDQILVVPVSIAVVCKKTDINESLNSSSIVNSNKEPLTTFTLKLMAVNDTKSKLIGLYQLKLNLRNFEAQFNRTVYFDKCIDKEGSITFSININSLLGYPG